MPDSTHQDETDEPRLAALGANTREAPSGHNLDVSGTAGPDYLGQETTTVDGHPCDRPGVKSRLPEDRPEDPRVKRMDTGEDLPVLLDSDMRAGPIEGTQGTYTQIVEGECARCGYDRLRVAVHTLAGEHQETCNACGAIQDTRNEHGYRLRATEKERAQMKREAGPTLGSLKSREVVDLEPDTGYGPMVSLVDDHSFTSLWKDDVEALFWMLVDNDDISVIESIESNAHPAEKVAIGAALLPECVEIDTSGCGDGSTGDEQ